MIVFDKIRKELLKFQQKLFWVNSEYFQITEKQFMLICDKIHTKLLIVEINFGLFLNIFKPQKINLCIFDVAKFAQNC